MTRRHLLARLFAPLPLTLGLLSPGPARADALAGDEESRTPAPVAIDVAALPSLRTPGGTLVLRPAPGAESFAALLLEVADADRARVAALFGRDWDGATEVRIVPVASPLQPLVPPDRVAPSWAAGVAFPEKNLLILRVDADLLRGRATLRHELSHIAAGRLVPGRLPRWFLEGLAELQSLEPHERGGPDLVRAAVTGALLPFSELSDRFPANVGDVRLAYLQSADFVQFLADRRGESSLRDVVHAVVGGRPFDLAIVDSVGARVKELETEWRGTLTTWPRVMRVLGSQEALWAGITLLFLYAAWKLRRRRIAAFARMEAEEQAEKDRQLAEWLARTEAVWADGPPLGHDPDERIALTPLAEAETPAPTVAPPLAPPDTSDPPAAAPDADTTGDADDDLDDDGPTSDEADESAPPTGPQKPTLH